MLTSINCQHSNADHFIISVQNNKGHKEQVDENTRKKFNSKGYTCSLPRNNDITN